MSIAGAVTTIFLMIWTLICIALCAYSIVVYWLLFQKAGVTGWGALIPFYSQYLLFKIAFGNGWWFLMCLVPIANIVFVIMLWFRMARAFGKGTGYGFGLWLLNIIFLSILAFSPSIRYEGPVAF